MKTNKKLLKYQIDATNYCIKHLLENKEFKLESPTGSGKTFIISQIIDQYLENDNLNSWPTTFLFIAPSTGNLDYQGYEKITQYIKKDWAKGFSTQYIGTHGNKNSQISLQSVKFFEPNKVYFLGWQLLKSGTNITEINSEKNNIYNVIYNTKSNKTNIILIIDEAHREVRTDKKNDSVKQEFLKQLDPSKIIKVSATLSQVQQTPDYKITYDDVREECAIKKNVQISSIDQNVNNIEKYTENSQLILSALEKQKKIKNAYFRKNINNVNPLILIQIPDEVVIDNEISTEKQLLIEIEKLLQVNGLVKKCNYAIWLDKEKTNTKEEIINNDSTIDVLIFKQAIATGWDIPRANILVRIREAKTKSFNIQTLGRILRNPFFKYYDNELIDDAFVFTRDDKYKEYIKQEEIVSDIDDKVKVKRSQKAINSKFSINKVNLAANYSNEQLIEHVSDKIVKNNEFKSIFFKDKSNDVQIIRNINIDSRNIFESPEEIQKEVEKQKYINTQMNFAQSKPNLFQLFIKFKTITKSSQLINQILNSITNKLKNINKTIKEFHNSCINNWDNQLFSFNNEKLTLKELIIRYKDLYLENKIEHNYEIYQLPEQYEFIKSKIDKDNWDEVNSFNISFKKDKGYIAFDSQNEQEFYKKISYVLNIASEKSHIFRNGTSEKCDYYVEYLDEDSKIRKFFPDFILINEENKTCFIFEAKGHNKNTDIDKMSKYKFNEIKKIIENKSINKEYHCPIIFKVSYVDDDVKFFDISNNENIDFKDVLKQIKNYKNA